MSRVTRAQLERAVTRANTALGTNWTLGRWAPGDGRVRWRVEDERGAKVRGELGAWRSAGELLTVLEVVAELDMMRQE